MLSYINKFMSNGTYEKSSLQILKFICIIKMYISTKANNCKRIFVDAKIIMFQSACNKFWIVEDWY